MATDRVRRGACCHRGWWALVRCERRAWRFPWGPSSCCKNNVVLALLVLPCEAAVAKSLAVVLEVVLLYVRGPGDARFLQIQDRRKGPLGSCQQLPQAVIISLCWANSRPVGSCQQLP